MKIFLSWSGERSQQLAQAIRDWLPLALYYVEPWISNSDIEAGERWANEVAKELEISNFGIICLTKENISSPWILFEAGALAKFMMEGRVIPLLLDIEFKDIVGPLAQFQSKKFYKNGIFEIVCAINKLSSSPVPDARLTQLFETLWPQLENKVAAIPESETKTKNRPQHEVLEELVSGVRGLELRLRETIDENNPRRRIRRRGNIEMMLEYSSRRMRMKHDDPLALVIVTSFLKESFPWIHDISLELYRESTINGHSEGARRARRQLIRAIRMVNEGPMLDMMTDGSKYDYMIMREVERYIRYFDASEVEHSTSDAEAERLSGKPISE